MRKSSSTFLGISYLCFLNSHKRNHHVKGIFQRTYSSKWANKGIRSRKPRAKRTSSHAGHTPFPTKRHSHVYRERRGANRQDEDSFSPTWSPAYPRSLSRRRPLPCRAGYPSGIRSEGSLGKHGLGTACSYFPKSCRLTRRPLPCPNQCSYHAWTIQKCLSGRNWFGMWIYWLPPLQCEIHVRNLFPAASRFRSRGLE